jgi:hypothetical protein
MYDAGKIINMGGADPPTATAEVIDLNAPAPSWRAVASMANPRRQMTATLLADGRVLVTGGTRTGGFNTINNPHEAVYAAELWNPVTEGWTTGASMAIPRVYHSTAVLLPDATVLSAGGGQPAAAGENTGGTPPNLFGHFDAERFYPPYLFNANGTFAARPVITSAPANVNYNQTFFVGTNGASISKVTLIRLSSVTHSFNENQRLNNLSFAQVAGGLNVTAPSSANRCPPGHYMLFIINSSGVPSVARILRLP